jgi:hypothetical protein
MLGCLSRIGRPPLRQIHADAVLIRPPPPPDPPAARSAHCLDHTTAAPIRPQLRRSATTGAAIHSINHSDVAAI